MANKKPTITIHSRIEITDPALVKKLEAARKKIRPMPGQKPFLEMLIEQGLQAVERNQMRARNLHVEPQPEGER